MNQIRKKSAVGSDLEDNDDEEEDDDDEAGIVVFAPMGQGLRGSLYIPANFLEFQRLRLLATPQVTGFFMTFCAKNFVWGKNYVRLCFSMYRLCHKINQVCFRYMYYKFNDLIRLYMNMKDHAATQFSV